MIEYKELLLKLDTRVIEDLNFLISIRSLAGISCNLDYVLYRIVEAINEDKENLEIRYKSNDPKYRSG